MRICQLLNFASAFFLISCSTPKVDVNRDQRIISASWLKIPPRFSLRDKDDNYLTHPFFDVDPQFSREKRTIHYFVTTPEESSSKFDLDLNSGRLYTDRQYCPADDVWEAYTGELQTPNFTQGIVPRTYDQNDNPQRLIIFGMPKVKELKDAKQKFNPQFYDVGTIVGSFVVESCESYPCDLKSKWKSSQILIAVNQNETNPFLKVNLLSQLRSKTDWPYVKAMITNQDGVHQVGNKFYPAFRISKELGLDDTLRYFETNSHSLKMDDLSKWREGCFKLYDDFWDKTEKVRKEKLGRGDLFWNLFKDFYAKNSDEFYKCSRLVRAASINDDPRRLWFFAYVEAFTILEKNQYYFSCSDKTWAYNPRVDDTHLYNDQKKELERCHSKDFERSFDQAINGLSLLKNLTNNEYRFVEYDSALGGTHQKIYNWILKNKKMPLCKYKKDLFKGTAWAKESSESQFDIFPQDVVWEAFTSDDDKTIK